MKKSLFVWMILVSALIDANDGAVCTVAYGKTCVSKADIDLENDWERSECTGLTRLDPAACKCVETCPNGYGNTYQKVTDTYIQFDDRYTKKVVEQVNYLDKEKTCHNKCSSLTSFTCTAFVLLPYEGEEYSCFMFETTVLRRVNFKTKPVYVRDCPYE